ncbi:MAG: hypothetical protein ACT4O2_08155 [Beijerinckiaceae bacterium]
MTATPQTCQPSIAQPPRCCYKIIYDISYLTALQKRQNMRTNNQHYANIRERKMKEPASLARKLSRVSKVEKTTKPIEITEIVEGAQGTAAYIAQLTGELATLASGARFANLALLLARAQLEAELWSSQSN